MSRVLSAVLAVMLLLSLCACGKTEPPVPEEPPIAEEMEPEPIPEPEPTPEEVAAQEIEVRLASMTTEEKVGQLFFVRCPAESAVEDVAAYH